MGFQRASDDLTEAALNPEAGRRRRSGCSTCSTSTRSPPATSTDRYKAFGTGQGSMFLTGPWTLNGYVADGLNFTSFQMPQVGEDSTTYFELGGLEMYAQEDESRYEMTAQAVKWLSDNSFLWTTDGRGAAVRQVDPRPGRLPDRRAALGRARRLRRGDAGGGHRRDPGQGGPDFTIYTGSDFVAQTMDPVWAGERGIEEGDPDAGRPVGRRSGRGVIDRSVATARRARRVIAERARHPDGRTTRHFAEIRRCRNDDDGHRSLAPATIDRLRVRPSRAH